MKKILEMQFSLNEMKDEIMDYTNNKIGEIYPKK